MKVKNEMATRITVNTVEAANSMRAFRQAISATTNAWKANELAMKNSGDFTGAAKQKMEGLNNVIELQKARLSELKERMAGVDQSTQQGARQYVKLQKEISTATRQLNSYEGQLAKAKSQNAYYASGLADLQKQYKLNQSASKAYADRLDAEKNALKASEVRLNAAKDALKSLREQQSKQKEMLRQVAAESGKTSEAYQKQKMQLDKTGESVAKTKDQVKSLQTEYNKLHPTGIKAVDTATQKLSASTTKLKSKAKDTFASIKANALAASVGIAALSKVAYDGAKKSTELQDSYIKTQNLLITGGEHVAEVTKNVNQMQKDGESLSVKYGVSQQKIADAYQELTKRGYKSGQSLGAMKIMLQASAASGEDLNTVVESSTAALEAFGLKADGTAEMMQHTKKAVNEMAYAADMTATDFKSMSVAMEYTGPSAKQLGYSVGQTAAAIGVLSNNGLEADKAGTGLRKVMNSLIKPTKGGQEALDSMNLSMKDFTDKNGKMKSMTEIFGLLNKHTKGLTAQEKGALFKALFGAEGQSAALILANNTKYLNKLNGEVAKSYKGQGYVQQLAQKNMGSAKMSMRQFQEAGNAVAMTLGKALLPTLRDTSVAMAKAFNSKEGQKDIKQLSKAIGGLFSATGKLVQFMFQHISTITKFAKALAVAFAVFEGMKLVNSIKRTTVEFGNLLKVTGKALKPSNIKKHYDQLSDSIDSVGASIKRVPKKVKTKVSVPTTAAKRQITGLNNKLKTVPKKVKTTAVASTTAAKTKINSVKATAKQVPGKIKTKAVAEVESAKVGMRSLATTAKRASVTTKSAFTAIKVSAVTSMRAIGMAIRANPVGALVTGIQIAIWAFTALYTHSKKFRKFCNGLAKEAKNVGKQIGKWFGQGWNSVKKATSNGIKSAQKSWSKFKTLVSKTTSAIWKSTTKAFSSGWNSLKKSTSNGVKQTEKHWSNFKSSVAKTTSGLWKDTKSKFSQGWSNLVKTAQRGAKDVQDKHNALSKTLSKTSKSMFADQKGLFNVGYKVIEDRTQTWHDLTHGKWNRLYKDTKQTASDMNNYHRQLFRGMYNKLNEMTDGKLGDMVKKWQSKMGSIGDAVNSAKGTIHRHFVDLVRGVIKPFNDMLGGIKKGLNWVLDKLGSSKIGGEWSVSLPSYATGTNDTHPGGWAKVNDGLTNHYREMYRLPNGQVGMFPAKRNMIVPLPKGTSVLDGEQSYRLMRALGKIPHYASGIGDFFSGLISKGEDALDGLMENVDKILKSPVEFMESVFKKFVNVSSPISFAKDLITGVPKYIAKQMKDWIKKQFQEVSDPAGSGVERWRPYVLRALKMLDLSESLVGKVLKQIQTESGGNAKALGGDDGLSDGRATGLMQVKPPTFRAYKLPGHNDIWNGFDNLLAGLNYAKHRYGNSLYFLGQGHGYANGGLVATHGFYEMAENNLPEYIIPTDINKRSRAYQLLGEVVARFQAQEPHQPVATASTSNSDRELAALSSKFDRLLVMFESLLQLSGNQIQAIQAQGSFDKQSFYKQQARDLAMKQIGLGGAGIG